MSNGTVKRVHVVEPITIGCYKLTATGCEIHGRPTFADHEGVGEFIKRAHRASGFWLADWLRYGETRRDWQERISQVVDATGLSEKTVKNIRAVGAIEPSRRRDSSHGVEFGHHEAVASLTPEEQSEWLERVESEGWNVHELRANIKASKRTKVIEGQARLEGMYRVIYADPPWSYRSNQSRDGGTALGKAENHYGTMSIEDICKLPVQAHALPNSVLFLWVTAPMLMENPGPREVIEAWGFKPKTGMVWDKVLGNYGHYVHVHHEHLLICTRGSCLPDAPTPAPDSVLVERRSSTHSEKPDSIRKMISKLYTTGPYLELFARERHLDWDSFGNDARLWAQEAAGQ